MRIFRNLYQFIFKISPMILGLGMVLAFQSSVLAQRTITYNSTPGSGFVVPYKTTAVQVQLWGAGGGGGFVDSNRGGGGGGGGAFLQVNSFPVSVGTIAVTVGIGGGGQSPTLTPGGTGGNSSFGSLSVNGGAGANGLTGGNGGTIAPSGDIRTAGSSGTNASNSGNSAGGNGGNGANSTGTGGAGGPSSSEVGLPGTQPGGGGGGEGANGANGGRGGDGRVIVTWACSSSLSSGNPNPAPVCLGSGIGPIVYDFTGATGYSIIWSPSTPLGVNVTSDAVTGTVTIQGTPTSAGTFNYTISPTYPAASSGSCSGPGSFSGSFTVTPNNTTGTISVNTFCANSSLPGGVTQSTTGATGIGAPTGLPPGVSVAWAGNQITFSGTPTTAGTYNYSIPLTGGCGTINATGTITVNAVPAITAQATPGGTTCINGAAFAPMSVGTGFGYTYQWFSNDTPDYTTPTLISGATTNTYTPLNTTAGTLYYYVVVSSPSCVSVTSPVSGAYIATPNNTVSAASSSPVVCINPASPITITHTTSGATAIGAASGLPAGVTASWAANTLTITGTPTNSGVFNYSIPLTGGCGSVNATGTITVNAEAAIFTPSLASQPAKCINSGNFNAISVGTGTGFTYQWYRNDSPDYVTPTLIPGATSNSYSPLSDVDDTSYYYVVVSSPSCGTSATSAVSGAFVVNPLPVVSFIDQPIGPNICVDTDVTYETQPGQSNYTWVIPGILGQDYTITSGGHSGSQFVVLKWLTPGSKSVSVNYTDANSCGATTAATSNSVNVIKNTVTLPTDTNPSSCFINRTITPFTHTTSLATGILNNGISGANGLPLGLSAVFSGGNTITISGTVDPTVAPGIYNYSIPLTGGCGTVAATGFIDVQPNYQLTKITSVSPSIVGGTATITIEGDPAIFTNGTYQVTYALGLSNAGSETKTVTFSNGKAVFSSLSINSEDLTSLTISQIKKTTDDCYVLSTQNNVTFFGIKAATFTTSGTYYVPAGIYEITIKVWGGGGGGGNGSNGSGGGGGGYSVRTLSVVPGEAIGIFIGQGGNAQQNGGDSWATRDSSPPNSISNSLVYAKGGAGANGTTPGTYNPALPSLTSFGWGNTATGGNGALGNGLSGNAQIGGKGGNGGGATGGQGGLGGSGNGTKPGDPGQRPGGGGGGAKGGTGGIGGSGLVLISFPLPPIGPCFKVVDDGSISGTTVIEFTCDYDWTAPEGLAEFTVYVGSGGGGGGSGFGSGGGGSGALIRQSFTTSNPYGLPRGTVFPIKVGDGGNGASAANSSGANGQPSSFSGSIDGSSINIIVQGGGGGGSQSSNPGANGSSGGGGGAKPNPNGDRGLGGSSIPITYSGSNVTLYQGNPGGNGDFNTNQNAIAGGGGGGLVAWVSADRPDGKAAGAGQGEGGNGGSGVLLNLGDSLRYFGAGGGGIGEYFNGTEKVGIGGFADGVKLGGDGNLSSPTAVGGAGKEKTGSGGGAGYGAGGKGGKGIVYITYPVFRILPIEYLYFNATYNSQNRSGELTWATSKEWENSHFEIERAVNNVKTWTKVGEINGHGYSDTPVEYSFTDSNLPASGGNIFYRLKQVDMDGDFSYSVTKSIQVNALKGLSAWIAYPNPSELGSTVTVALLENSEINEGAIQIRISDVRGVYQTFTVQNPEDVSAAVNSYLENARSGMYIVQILWGNKSEQIKLVRK